MKKQIRFAAGMMAASMLALTMAGCSGSSSSSAAAGSGSTAAGGSEEEITLRFVSWQTNHADANQAVADAYHELHPNITVEFEYLGDMNSNEYLTKTDIMLMGGEEIDILMTPSFMAYASRADSGSYLDLTPYFEAEGTTAKDEYNVIVENDGAVYGIPGEMKYNLVLINKDMLDEAGLPVPDLDWTWDDYRDYAIAMSSGSGADAVYGSYFHSWGNENLKGIGSAKLGSTYFNDDGTLTFDNPAFADFLEFRYNLENVDKASTPLADVKALNMNYRDQFFNGKIGMLSMGTFMLSDIGNEIYTHDFVTTFARMPVWNEGDPHYNGASAQIFSVARTSAHPQEAYDFLRFWTTEGVNIKGMFVTNEKGADRMESVNQIVANFTDKVDLEALEKIMNDPDWVDSYETYTPAYQSQIDTILTEETDRYLLGSQSLEDTVNNLMERGNQIIEENS